jgi:UDP-3-O-[3-hydroxymyristoyl] glucosamine N-acyltransferase
MTTIIGDNVTIHAGTILADALLQKKREDGFDQLLSGGRVVIKDNVGIGALAQLTKELLVIPSLAKELKLIIRCM